MMRVRPSMFADMIVIVEGIVTVVEQSRYDLYSWYVLLVDGDSRICNQIYRIPRAAMWTLLLKRCCTSICLPRQMTPVCTMSTRDKVGFRYDGQGAALIRARRLTPAQCSRNNHLCGLRLFSRYSLLFRSNIP